VVKQGAGPWNPERRVWHLRYDRSVALAQTAESSTNPHPIVDARGRAERISMQMPRRHPDRDARIYGGMPASRANADKEQFVPQDSNVSCRGRRADAARPSPGHLVSPPPPLARTSARSRAGTSGSPSAPLPMMATHVARLSRRRRLFRSIACRYLLVVAAPVVLTPLFARRALPLESP
jgi:hypothetical protein